MVGVEDFYEVSEEQMEWLKNGGRNRIMRMAKRFLKIWWKAGRRGDFYVSIILPSDLFVVARRKNSGVSTIWRFDHDKIEFAQKLCEDLKKLNDDLEVLKIAKAKDYLGLESDLTIFIHETWHGNDVYEHTWEYIRTVIPAELFPKGI